MGGLSSLSQQKRELTEWGHQEYDIQVGCRYNCLYCYSNHDRSKGINNIKNRITGTCDILNDIVMFPLYHEITRLELPDAMLVLKKLFDNNNFVVYSTKTDYTSIKSICDHFKNYKDKLLFRFTIGSTDNNILKFWEPLAPTFEERMQSLELASESGFNRDFPVDPHIRSKMGLRNYRLIILPIDWIPVKHFTGLSFVKSKKSISISPSFFSFDPNRTQFSSRWLF